MRVSFQRLEANTIARQVLAIIVFAILCLSVLVKNSESAEGICDLYEYETACCTDDTDCPGGTCILKKGVCSIYGPTYNKWTPCDVDSECESIPDLPNWCVPVGRCVGGDMDGFACAVAKGICLPAELLCRDSQDCPEGSTCGAINMCNFPGVCVPCVGGCSIATATFGTELQYRIDVLQSFRNKYLINNDLGRTFVMAYYQYSPPIAKHISERWWLRSVVRILLLPVIGIVSLFV